MTRRAPPGLGVWDGNPEVFEIDPDALGRDHLELAAGSRLTAEGVLAYSFGDYQLWPTSTEVLDHAVVGNTASTLVHSVSFCRGNADVPVSAASQAEHPMRSSDHDGLVITFGPRVRGGGGGRRTPSPPAFWFAPGFPASPAPLGPPSSSSAPAVTVIAPTRP